MNDEPVKPKVKRLDFGKKNPIDQAEEDAIDASIAPLPKSTLTSAYADDDKGEFLEPADQPVEEIDENTVLIGQDEPELVPNTETVEALEASEAGDVERADSIDEILSEGDAGIVDQPVEVDQAEGMEMTEMTTEVAETGTLDEITATDDAAREAAAAAEDEVESIADLEAKELDIKAQIESRKEAEKQHVCGEIVKVMSQYTVDIDYLAAFMGVKYKRKGSKAKPKYRDPMTGKTWSGRGKTPVWIRGKDFSKFLI